MNKPVAITGLAFILVAAGLTCILIAVGAMPLLGEAQGSGLLISTYAIIGAACFLLAYGLFTLKSWAWPFGIGLAIASAGMGLLSILVRASLVGTVLAFLPALVLLAGLLMPDVRKALGHDKAQPAKSGARAPTSKINQPNPEKQAQHKPHKTGRR
jgi:hypothetical protein